MPDELERDVLDRFVRGDRDAFERLFRHFEREVYRWALGLVRDTAAAEDVVVEAFWRAYRGRARFDPSRSFGAWMRRIVTNAARDHLRKAPLRESGLPVDQLRAPARDVERDATVRLAFRRLPPKLQIVATLALVENEPYAEIADALDVPVGTVKSRVFRAIRALRKELTRLGIHHD